MKQVIEIRKQCKRFRRSKESFSVRDVYEIENREIVEEVHRVDSWLIWKDIFILK